MRSGITSAFDSKRTLRELPRGLGVDLPIDEKYYREISPGSMAEQLLISARNRIFQDFRAYVQPSHSDQVLDVGVSDVVNDGANVLERSYPHQENITACGLGAAVQFKKAFPLVRYTQIEPNVRLPFDDNTFDIATSNAVLEHVGSLENQSFFVHQLCRVARRVFIVVPNRFFPIEHHTALPIVHYQDNIFQIACRIAGKSEWARDENLILMTRKRLWQLAAPIERRRPLVILVYCSDHFHPICISYFARQCCQVRRLGMRQLSLRGPGHDAMSAFGTKQTSASALQMSAFGGKADIADSNSATA